MDAAKPHDEGSLDGQLERKLGELADRMGTRGEAQECSASDDSILFDSSVSQQLTRREADGFDTLFGYFRCPFEVQQQRYVLHIPLQPSMLQIPTVEAVVVDFEDANVRVTDRQKYGLRIEIVLGQPATEELRLVAEVTAYAELP